MSSFRSETIRSLKAYRSFREDWTAIEGRCIDSSLPTFPSSLGVNKEALSANTTCSFLSSYQTHCLAMLASQMSGGMLGASQLLGALLSLYSLKAGISQLQDQIYRLIANEPGAFSLLGTFHEEFNSLDNVDPTSSAYVNTEKGYLAPTITVSHNVQRKDMSVSPFVSQGTFTSEVIPSGMKPTDSKELIGTRIYTSPTAHCLLKIYFPAPRGSSYRALGLEFPPNNGIEEITVIVSTDKGEKVLFKGELRDIKLLLSSEEYIRSVSIQLLSNRTDGANSQGTYHQFMMDSATFYDLPAGSQTTFLSTSIAIPGMDTFSIVRLKSPNVPKGIGFYVSGLLVSGQWSDWQQISPDGIHTIHLAGINTLTNIQNPAARRLTPSNKNGVAYLNTLMADQHAIRGLLQSQSSDADDNKYEIDPSSFIGLRRVGKKSFGKGEDESVGWKWEYGLWKTHFMCSAATSLNFGRHRVQLDGTIATGIVSLSSGLHTIGIPPESYYPVGPGFTASQMKAADPLYPHNCKYLIQGYTGVDAYPGTDVYGAYICKCVAPEVLQLDEYDPTYFSFVYDRINGYTYPAVMVKADDPYLYKEEIVFWVTTHDTSSKCSKIRVKIEMPVTDIMGLCISSYTLMVT